MRTILFAFALPALLAAQQSVASDCSADGVVVNSVTGEPVSRARVSLIGPAGAPSSLTDSVGHFLLSRLPCAPATVSVSRTGFLLTNTPASASLHDLKIKLNPQVVIAGKIVDDQGDPVPATIVTALMSTVAQGRRTFRQVGNANTNDLGEYRLFGLQSGKYVLCARATRINEPATDATTTGEVCYPGPVEGGVSSAMDLLPGREARVDMTLPRVPAVHVRGTVTGLPQTQNVGMSLVKRGVAANAGNYGSPVRDGRFDIAGVTAGSYLLSVDYWETGKRLTARVPVEVGSSDIENVSVHLEPAFTVSGTLRIDSKSSARVAAPNFTLRAVDPSVGGGPIQWNKDHTAFTMADLPPGSYRLEGFLPPPFYIKSALLNGRDISKEEILLGAAAGPIDVVISDEAGMLEGDVSDSDGQATSSFVVILQDESHFRVANAGANGHFKLTGLAPGDYRIYAWNTQQAEYANPDWLKHFSATPVTVQTGQTAQVKLTEAKVDF